MSGTGPDTEDIARKGKESLPQGASIQVEKDLAMSKKVCSEWANCCIEKQAGQEGSAELGGHLSGCNGRLTAMVTFEGRPEGRGQGMFQPRGS